MNKICINVHVPRNAAIAGGAILYGDTEYEPSAKELSELSELELPVLLKYEGKEGQRLQLKRYDPEMWPLVREAIAEALMMMVEEAIKRSDKARARIDLHNWACNQSAMPSLVEPARRDYDIGSRYLQEAAHRLASVDMQLIGVKLPIIAVARELLGRVTFEVRTSPALFALTLEDRICGAIHVLRPLFAPETRISQAPISRITTDGGTKQTVIAATISHPAVSSELMVIWSAEEHRPLDVALAEMANNGAEL